MSFTFSHPAIVLPLVYISRKRFSLTGLIVGSITPDFEYFIRMKPYGLYSHTLSGLLWFDLPLGIMIAFIFHNLIRNQLLENLPLFLRTRLMHIIDDDWNSYFKANWLVVIISIVIGAASHIFWDAFTHEHGYFVVLIPILQDQMSLFSLQFPVFKLLQHLSTMVGGTIIAIAIYQLPKVCEDKRSLSMKYWALIIVITLIIILIRVLFGLDYHNYPELIVTSISAGLLALIVTSILFKKTSDHNTSITH